GKASEVPADGGGRSCNNCGDAVSPCCSCSAQGWAHGRSRPRRSSAGPRSIPTAKAPVRWSGGNGGGSPAARGGGLQAPVEDMRQWSRVHKRHEGGIRRHVLYATAAWMRHIRGSKSPRCIEECPGDVCRRWL